ncbi:MAG: sodium/solute symporter [Kiritimatiellales bacterium]
MDANEVIMDVAATGSGLGILDWLVIAGYLFGMIFIGWFFSKEAKTAEGYLLGGRQMKSAWVGLSLFATLLSAISYLMVPGEVIQNGPAFMLGKIAAYPIVVLIVGFFLIPVIMKLKITSAYEMLETRLGLGVRMLGSVFFLLLRLMWMAAIVYTTSAKVLIPIFGLSESVSIYFCFLITLITIAYTSMGGLKATVYTDVVQSFVLFGGTFLTIGIIAFKLGGIGNCIPSERPAHWPEFQWGFGSAPGARTFMAALISTVVWFVSTNGSDQTAIQRYLSTQDVKTARRTLTYAMAASGFAGILLTIVGLCLLSFYQTKPELLGMGAGFTTGADKVFPLYITSQLPAGLSGLVLSGLLAAAMSSLSSGLNSSCSVVMVDFIGRFRGDKKDSINPVKMAKLITVCIGIVVVLFSVVVGMVKGNLLDMAFKICNLLTAPLFGLFFMAIFVRRATGAGTLIGAAAGVITVFVISFWEDLFLGPTGLKGISILWAMPVCLLVQIVTGVLASLVVGTSGPPLDRD